MKLLLPIILLAFCSLDLHGQTYPYNGFFPYQRMQINPAALPDIVYREGLRGLANLNVRKPNRTNDIPDYQGLLFNTAQFNLNTKHFQFEEECPALFFPVGMDFQTDWYQGRSESSRVNLRAQAVKNLGTKTWLSLGFNLTHTNLHIRALDTDGFLFQNIDDPVLNAQNWSNNYLGTGVFFHHPYLHAGISMPELLSLRSRAQATQQHTFRNRSWHALLGGSVGNKNCDYFLEFDSWLRFVPGIEFDTWLKVADANFMVRFNRTVNDYRIFGGTGVGINQRAQLEVGVEHYHCLFPWRFSVLYDAGLSVARTVPNLEFNFTFGIF